MRMRRNGDWRMRPAASCLPAKRGERDEFIRAELPLLNPRAGDLKVTSSAASATIVSVNVTQRAASASIKRSVLELREVT